MSNSKDAGVRSVGELRQFAQNLDAAQRELDMLCNWLNNAMAGVCQTWNDKQLAAFKPKFEEKTMEVYELSSLVKRMSQYINLYCSGIERINNISMRRF